MFWVSLFLCVCIFADTQNRLHLFRTSVEKDEGNSDILCKSNLPCIFHIVLDTHTGFCSKDFCDSFFKNELEKRGFVNFKKQRSNYNRTHVSMPSIMNLDYIQKVLKKDLNNCTAKDTMYAYSDNVVFSTFKRLGYKINFISNVVNNLTVAPFLQKEEVCLLNRHVESIFIPFYFSSIFAIFFKRNKYVSHVHFLTKAFKIFEKICTIKQPQKTYSFVHFLAPHFPYFCNENGEKNKSEDFENFEKYEGYQKFVNKKILEFVDLILSKQSKNTLIIIHGDHGLHFSENTFDTLLSVYFPDNETKIDFESFSLVNLFRFLFNKYLKTNYEFLDERFFITDSNNAPLKEVES
ncbi:MAG: sulfatase-like hydrolase/transferase [Clostridium sp.]|nr:sulfatase-like hydrolase/transferase [Clostridium sp.]